MVARTVVLRFNTANCLGVLPLRFESWPEISVVPPLFHLVKIGPDFDGPVATRRPPVLATRFVAGDLFLEVAFPNAHHLPVAWKADARAEFCRD